MPLKTCYQKTSVIIKVVNIVLVPAIPAGMYTSIEISTFRTGSNTSRTGHVPTIPANFGQYQLVQKKNFSFLNFLIFEFFLEQNGNLFTLTY